MFSTHFLTLFFAIFAFGMLAYAQPVPVVARNNLNLQDLLNLLVQLQAKVQAQVDLLDGKTAIDGPLGEIGVLIKAFVGVLATVHLDLSGLDQLLHQIVNLLLNIIHGIFGGLAKYDSLDSSSGPITSLLAVIAQLFVKLNLVIPHVLVAQIVALLNVNINLPIVGQLLNAVLNLLKAIL